VQVWQQATYLTVLTLRTCMASPSACFASRCLASSGDSLLLSCSRNEQQLAVVRFVRLSTPEVRSSAAQGTTGRSQAFAISSCEEEGAVLLELARSAATTAPVSYAFNCVISVIGCFQGVLLLLQALPRGPAILCLQQIA